MATPEEREPFLSTGRPFDMDAWLREVPPSTPEELVVLEEWLREREADRERSLARDEERLRALAE